MKAERSQDILLQAPAAAPLRIERRSHLWAVIGFVVFVLLPTALTGLYFYTIAADRYVTEFRFAVRSGPASFGGGDGDGGGGAGIASGVAASIMADSFILEQYLRSPAAIEDVEARLPLREMLGRDGGDPVRRYDPTLPPEELIDFWQGAVTVEFDVVTGITTVQVALFRPEDSVAVAAALVEELGILVDELSERARTEMLSYVEAEFALAESKLTNTLDAIETFRRENEVVSPTTEAELGSSVIATLTAELTELRVRLRTLLQNVPNSPQIPVLTDRIASLEAQVAVERRAMGGFAAGAGGALPGQLSVFERLQSEYLIARDIYTTTLAMQQRAKASATLSMATLVVFVPPRTAVISLLPLRWLETLVVFLVAFLFWVIGRIFLASIRTP